MRRGFEDTLGQHALISTDENARVAVGSRCWASAKACWLSDWTTRLSTAGIAEPKTAAPKRRNEKEAIIAALLEVRDAHAHTAKRRVEDPLEYWSERKGLRKWAA